MGNISTQDMGAYLSSSISSLNLNKLHGLLAEVDFRSHLADLGLQDRVSVGGWIARSEGSSNFAHNTIVLFPECIQPDVDYPVNRNLPDPPHGLHTVCATFHQIGIHSYFCAPVIRESRSPRSIEWRFIQLGLPTEQSYNTFPFTLRGFNPRGRRYNFLRYRTDVTQIPPHSIPEEFSKEHLRVTLQNNYLSEISDVDGILWGEQYTYPVEIKEKTAAFDARLGEWFGLDLGPFVKLAFYAAKRGNLHSIFIVREIDDPSERNLINWWFITFNRLAQFASWVPRGGGTNMLGGRSTVVKIPKAEFAELNRRELESL